MDWNWTAIAVVVLAVALLSVVQWRDMGRRRAARQQILDLVQPLLTEPKAGVDAQGFPHLEGRYRGRRVRLELILDQLAWRKLPALWLLATAYGPTQARSTLDILLRPLGQESWSPSQSLEHDVAHPAGWPAHIAIRTDDPAGLPPLEAIETQRAFLDEPRAKAITVTRRGVRLVALTHEARRAHYLVLRDAELGDFQVPRAEAEALLDRAVALLGALERQEAA